MRLLCNANTNKVSSQSLLSPSTWLTYSAVYDDLETKGNIAPIRYCPTAVGVRATFSEFCESFAGLLTRPVEHTEYKVTGF